MYCIVNLPIIGLSQVKQVEVPEWYKLETLQKFFMLLFSKPQMISMKMRQLHACTWFKKSIFTDRFNKC